MKKMFFPLIGLMVMLLSTTADAQTTIGDIRKAYQEQKQIIAQMNDDFPSEGYPPVFYHLHVSQNLPGTGMHHENVYMYYGELPSEDEFDPYPPHYLSFATTKYNFAAREFYEEYLFDKQGNVIFVYARTPDFEFPKMHEFRLYFDGQRLLRLNVKESERQDSFKDVYTGKTIPEQYAEFCSQYTHRANHILEMFNTIDAGTSK